MPAMSGRAHVSMFAQTGCVHVVQMEEQPWHVGARVETSAEPACLMCARGCVVCVVWSCVLRVASHDRGAMHTARQRHLRPVVCPVTPCERRVAREGVIDWV